FYEDARTVARVLGVALTARSKGENPIPMAGVPHHAVETYLHRMIAAGFKVAICEQMENPKEAKGVIRREVTRLVTPGTLTEEAMRDGGKKISLAAIVTADSDTATRRHGDAEKHSDTAPSLRPRVAASIPSFAAIAWCELSPGKFLPYAGSLPACADQLARI